MFKVFPNPALKGETVNLSFKKAGNYSIQIFDNSGKLYLSRDYMNISAKAVQKLQLPITLGNGTYFLKAVNYDLNKQFIDKLLIR